MKRKRKKTNHLANFITFIICIFGVIFFLDFFLNSECRKLYSDISKGFLKIADTLNTIENVDVNNINDYSVLSRAFGEVSGTAYNVYVSYKDVLKNKKCYKQTPDCITAMKDISNLLNKTFHIYYDMSKAVASVKSVRTPASKQKANSIVLKSIDVIDKNTADVRKATANFKKYCN